MNRFPAWLLIWSLISVAACGKSGGENAPPVPQPPVTVTEQFSNPLLPSGPDPWVIWQGGFYYYTHTQGNKISLWKTAKMSELKTAPVQTVWTAPSNGPNVHNVWAPELHYLQNKWYLYYTAGASPDHATQRSFVLENSNADPRTGSWTDRGKIADPSADFFAIDGTVFYHNNKYYFIWSGHATASDKTQRLYIGVMSDPWTISGSRQLISSPEFPWESVGGPPAVNEAPEILVNPSGKVFLIYSASGCWTDDYALGMLTLKSAGDPMNPADWTKSPQPVFTKNTANSVYGPGHNSFFTSIDNKENWILYHANSTTGQGCGDARSPRMQKFSWKPDGTPDFGQPININTRQSKPGGE